VCASVFHHNTFFDGRHVHCNVDCLDAHGSYRKLQEPWPCMAMCWHLGHNLKHTEKRRAGLHLAWTMCSPLANVTVHCQLPLSSCSTKTAVSRMKQPVLVHVLVLSTEMYMHSRDDSFTSLVFCLAMSLVHCR
jgi:hypothetical protein